MSNLVSNHPVVLQILMDHELYVIPEENATITLPEKEITAETPTLTNAPSTTIQPIPATEKLQIAELKTFGNVESKILLLVSDQNHAVCAATERELFKNICNAMNWTAQDYLIVNTAQNTIYTSETWMNTFQPEIVILFGVPNTEFEMTIPYNSIQKMGNTTFIKTQKLNELNEQKALKIALWSQLKLIKP